MSKEQHKTVISNRDELEKSYEARRPAYEEALSDLYGDIRSLLEAHGYTPTIKYRVKRFKNYFGKLKKICKGAKDDDAGLLTDVLGLRIICPFLEDLNIIEGLLAEHFPIVEMEKKREQHSFREFGYDSVHMLIKLKALSHEKPIPYTKNVCEIQLRTTLQDAWAEVEHELVYKSDIDLPNESIKRKLASLNATLTLSDLIFQEIRDYQKKLRHHGRKRRESIVETLQVRDKITFPQTTEWYPPTTMQVEPIPYSLASDLENIMISALNAHSHNDLETAIGLYDQLLEMDLGARVRAMVYNHRGMAYFSLGNFPQACMDFTKSIQHDGDSFRSFVNRGLVNRMLRKFDYSVEDYNRALDIDPSNHEGYFGRAQTFCEIQLLSRALEDCKKALELQPDFSPAHQLSELIHRGLFTVDKKSISATE
ncbi:RelA/SpoT domain-containing protein [Geopsychrobacter electrodiphilus]|uniref:RelA/SpoT domain-containing protein n=1 Tax=Geopsychrobacter electrodiphilus TaxID=225196 RepID=UPI00036936B6|nr:RelA/SpoT domain-containing protein [Geopsychrobacter electrodiphilus]